MKKIILLLITINFLSSITNNSSAQTRLYMRTTAPVAEVMPRSITTFPPHSAWNVTTGFTRLLVGYYYSTNSNILVNSAPSGAASPLKVLSTQWFSPGLITQTISGTFTAQIRLRTNSAGATGQGFIYLRLVNPDGTLAAEIGTLTTTDIVKTGSVLPTNRTFTPLTLTNVAITGGQRLVIELGWNYSAGSATGAFLTYASQNDRAAADLPADDVNTDNLNPWFQFSQTLKLQTQNIFF